MRWLIILSDAQLTSTARTVKICTQPASPDLCWRIDGLVRNSEIGAGVIQQLLDADPERGIGRNLQ